MDPKPALEAKLPPLDPAFLRQCLGNLFQGVEGTSLRHLKRKARLAAMPDEVLSAIVRETESSPEERKTLIESGAWIVENRLGMTQWMPELTFAAATIAIGYRHYTAAGQLDELIELRKKELAERRQQNPTPPDAPKPPAN